MMKFTMFMFHLDFLGGELMTSFLSLERFACDIHVFLSMPLKFAVGILFKDRILFWWEGGVVQTHVLNVPKQSTHDFFLGGFVLKITNFVGFCWGDFCPPQAMKSNIPNGLQAKGSRPICNNNERCVRPCWPMSSIMGEGNCHLCTHSISTLITVKFHLFQSKTFEVIGPLLVDTPQKFKHSPWKMDG